MKWIFFVLCTVGVATSYAQNYVDILHTEYTKTPQNSFENSNNTTNLEKLNVNLTTPIQLKNGNAFLTGVVYDRVRTTLFNNQVKENVSSYILKLGMNIKHSEEWSSTYLLLPKIASNFGVELRKEDIQIGAIALFKKKKSEYLTYKFGAYANADRFGPFLVPLFGAYYQKNKLEMDIMVPSYANINYSVQPKITLGVNWRATVKSYNRQTPTPDGYKIALSYLHQLSNEIAAHVGYEPVKGIIVRGMAGVAVGRSFRVYQNSDKIDFGLSLFRFGDDRVPLNTDFTNGAFARVELAYRYYLPK